MESWGSSFWPADQAQGVLSLEVVETRLLIIPNILDSWEAVHKKGTSEISEQKKIFFNCEGGQTFEHVCQEFVKLFLVIFKI